MLRVLAGRADRGLRPCSIFVNDTSCSLFVRVNGFVFVLTLDLSMDDGIAVRGDG